MTATESQRFSVQYEVGDLGVAKTGRWMANASVEIVPPPDSLELAAAVGSAASSAYNSSLGFALAIDACEVDKMRATIRVRSMIPNTYSEASIHHHVDAFADRIDRFLNRDPGLDPTQAVVAVMRGDMIEQRK